MIASQPSHRKPTPVRVFNHRDWQQCFDDFIRMLANKSGSQATAYCYQRMLMRFFHDPKKTPDTYTRAEVEAFLHAPTAGHRAHGTVPSPKTYNSRLTYIRSFYTYAANYVVQFRGKPRPLLRTISPFNGIPQAQVDVLQNRTLTPDAIHHILDQIPRNTIQGLRDRALLLCYFFTARRRSEIVNLHWRDIEQDVLFDDGHLGTLYHWRGKGRARQDDSAEMLAPAWNAIREYLEMDGRWDNMQPGDPIFVSCSTKEKFSTPQPLNPDSINRAFRQYLAAAGIDNDHGRISVHSLRHSAAFVRYAEEKDIIKIQKLLRHKSIAVTQLYIEEWERQPDTASAALIAKYGHF